MSTNEHQESRAEELAELTIKLVDEFRNANLSNGESVDILAVLLSAKMHDAMEAFGEDGGARVMDRFTQRLTHMHPNMRAIVVRRN